MDCAIYVAKTKALTNSAAADPAEAAKPYSDQNVNVCQRTLFPIKQYSSVARKCIFLS